MGRASCSVDVCPGHFNKKACCIFTEPWIWLIALPFGQASGKTQTGIQSKTPCGDHLCSSLGKVFLFSTFFKIFSVFGFLQFEYDRPRCFFFPFDIYIAWCSLNFLYVSTCHLFQKKSQLLLLQIFPLFLSSFFALSSPIIHVIPFVIVPQ